MKNYSVTDPDCPKCGKACLTYVEKQRASCDVEVYVEDGVANDVSAGSVDDTYDFEIVHIRCSACDTYWETQDSFLEDFNKTLKKEDDGCDHQWKAQDGLLKEGEDIVENVNCKKCGKTAIRVYSQSEIVGG